MIKKIVIEIAGQEIEMDLAEAKRVKSVLDDLFKKEYVSVPAPYPVSNPLTRPKNPFDYSDYLKPMVGDLTYSVSKNHL